MRVVQELLTVRMLMDIILSIGGHPHLLRLWLLMAVVVAGTYTLTNLLLTSMAVLVLVVVEVLIMVVILITMEEGEI